MGEPFAEEGNQEGKEDKGGAGVVLQEDEAGRDKHHEGKGDAGARKGEVDIDGTDSLGQGEGGGEFGELGGLEFEGTEVYPRLSAVGYSADKESNNKQDKDNAIYDIGTAGEYPWMDEQHTDGHNESDTHPKELLAMLT